MRTFRVELEQLVHHLLSSLGKEVAQHDLDFVVVEGPGCVGNNNGDLRRYKVQICDAY